MANTNVNENVEQAQQQFASVFAGPARSIAGKMLDYTQKLTNVQRESFSAYSEIGFRQMRSALEIRNSEDLRNYMEEQQDAARKVAEQMKSDMEEINSINQEFMQKSQEVTQEAMQRGQDVAQKNMERGQQRLQEVTKEGEKEIDKATQEAKSTSKK
ncbi:phasin family protein [Halomonas sp. PR-M31]|uniref:phasin family protein n=1 Tax=Halomonas sp. PR-M31 TaxID=1471202 RepID=UPI00069E7D21|nr:phasin family protein [Halomonas sp. PR-M31]